MDDTFRHLERLRNTEPRVAMATLVATHGTTARQEGARLFVGAGGRVLGSSPIGGTAEARIVREADELLHDGKPRLLHITVGDSDGWDAGLTGAGTMDVLLEPLHFGAPDPVAEAYDRARDEVGAGRPVLLVAPLDGRRGRLVVYTSGNSAGTLGDPIADEVARTRALSLLGGGRSVVESVEVDCASLPLYFERMAPRPTVVIHGGSPVAEALIGCARRFGMRAVVVEGRDRMRRELVAQADEVISGNAEVVAARLPGGPQVAIVLASQDTRYDVPLLRQALQGDTAFIAVLGSRRRGTNARDLLRSEGFTEEQLERVHAGSSDIGAQSAPEMALSLMTEIVATLRGRPRTGRSRQS